MRRPGRSFSDESPFRSGDSLELEVTDMALDGDPLARPEGYVVFVPGAIPGERVLARVRTATRKLARADLIRVLRASPHRVAPFCRHFGPCGGCSWQHIAYGEQLRLKRVLLESLLAHALGEAPDVQPTVGLDPVGPTVVAPEGAGPDATWGAPVGCAPAGCAPVGCGPVGCGPVGCGPVGCGPVGFRNKVHFVLSGDPRRRDPRGGDPRSRDPRSPRSLILGHYARGSKTLIPVEECPVHAPAGNRVAFRIRDVLAAHGIRGSADVAKPQEARHVLVRVAEGSGQTQATIVAGGKTLPGLEAVVRELAGGPDAPDGLHLNVHRQPGPSILGPRGHKLHGRDRLIEEVGGIRYSLSPTSFFQTNVRSASRLVEVVLGLVPATDRRPILDLFAGAGLFSIPLAARGHRVLAVEENPSAVKDGIASLVLNDGALRGRGHESRPQHGPAGGSCRFLRKRGEDAVRDLSRRGEEPRFGTAILDPPRDGCPASVLAALLGRLRPARIVYVSCNPRALAGDLLEARRRGYRIASVTPVDMFPHTPHIESVTLLVRGVR